MSDNSLYGVDPVNGRSKWNILDHTGPSSYVVGGETIGQSVYGGPNTYGLASYDAVIPAGESISGNYQAQTNYVGKGVRSQVKLKWKYTAGAGNGVVAVIQATAGIGMTPGTYALSFTNTGTNGSGAAGTITVTATAITNVTITDPGTGYTAAPAVSAATGGTPVVLTAQIGNIAGREVAAGVNLSAETIRLLAIGG